jgi:hypothetical protein
MSWHLDLAGVYVVLIPKDPAAPEDAGPALADLGVAFEIRPELGIVFPIAQLRQLQNIRNDITITVSNTLTTLWNLACFGPSAQLPATVSLADVGNLLFEWDHRGQSMHATLPLRQALALLASDVPFVATPDVWEHLNSLTKFGTTTGRVVRNADGFLEIISTHPQLIESLELPGLFRLDATHFGLPLSAAPALSADPHGLLIEDLTPLEMPPPAAPAINLAPHQKQDVEHLARALAAERARIVVRPSGLGRRVLVLAALDRLDAWPVLIITTPAQLWPWQRHLDLMGRSYSLSHADVDAHLMTYRDATLRRSLPGTPSIIFDQLSDALAQAPALHRLAGLRDSYRIDVENSWDLDVSGELSIMEILRPGEFTTSVPLAERYPPPSVTRARAHTALYIDETTGGDAPTGVRRSSTRAVTLTPEHLHAVDALIDRMAGAAAVEVLRETIDAVTSGTSHFLSPKIALAANLAREDASAARSCAIVTRSKKAATLLRSLLRPAQMELVNPGATARPNPGAISVVLFERAWPDLTGFDHVVIIDYPWSLATIDAATGPAANQAGSRVVTVLHASSTIDDRLAVLASRRKEMAALSREDDPPTLEEIYYILGV